MDTLFEGHIEKNVTMQDLLVRVLEKKPPGLSFLRVSSVDKTLEGRIYFQNGSRIIGASLVDSPLSGYEALKTVLKANIGSFALIVIGHADNLTGDTTLSIDLHNLLGRLDNLPPELSELFDQVSLLDNVFSPQADDPKPSIPSNQVAIAAAQPSINEPTAGDFPSSHRITDVVREAEMTNELHDLVSQRLTKPPMASAQPTTKTQLRTLSRHGRFEMRKGIRQALLLSTAFIALICAATVLWKQFGSSIQPAPKKILSSSPIRSHSEVSSNRIRAQGYGKRSEGTTVDAKQRTSTQRRRF